MIKRNLKKLRNYLKLEVERDKYKKRNKHNYTEMGCYFPCDVVCVGNSTYGVINAHYYKTYGEKLSIGSYCSIANDVHFFLGGEHDYKNLLTFPLKNYISNNAIKESISKGEIVVKDDVWIGYGAVILSGVTIEQGAVIGARSVVTKNIPPYAIFAGNRIVGYRFDKSVIDDLISVDFSKLSLTDIDKYFSYFYTHVNKDNIESITKMIGDITKHEC